VFHIYPTALDQHKEEVQAWTALRPSDRSAALYTTVLAASSTTTLYGLNITTENLVEWGMGLDIPPFVNELSSVLNIPSPQLNTKDVTMLKTPKKAIPLWPGCSVADDLYPGAFCNCPYGGQPHAAAALHDFPLFYTQLFSPLVCDNWLHVRPIEWGISAPQPKANFKHEGLVAH
jgi:hypothetical protein